MPRSSTNGRAMQLLEGKLAGKLAGKPAGNRSGWLAIAGWRRRPFSHMAAKSKTHRRKLDELRAARCRCYHPGAGCHTARFRQRLVSMSAPAYVGSLVDPTKSGTPHRTKHERRAMRRHCPPTDEGTMRRRGCSSWRLTPKTA